MFRQKSVIANETFMQVAMFAPFEEFKKEAPRYLGCSDKDGRTLPFYLVSSTDRLSWWLEQYAENHKDDLVSKRYSETNMETIFHWAVTQTSNIDTFKALLQHAPELSQVKFQGTSPEEQLGAMGAKNLKQALSPLSVTQAKTL
jgi:hypothetical protein